jgi:Pyridoxamine 5'-phosphate oxidase
MTKAESEGDWRPQKKGAMSKGELDAFLAEPHIARLACLKPDGFPYIVPAWYHWDGRAFWFVARERSVWAHYLSLDPRVSVVVDEPVPPIRKVIVEGTAIIVEAAVPPYLDNGEMSEWNKIGTNHTGPRYRENYPTSQYRDSISQEPCWTIKIVPRKTTTWQGLAWAKRYYHDDLKEPVEAQTSESPSP